MMVTYYQYLKQKIIKSDILNKINTILAVYCNENTNKTRKFIVEKCSEVLKKFPFADFKVICDESNNTVNITNKNTLKFVIAYRFNKGDEFTVIQYTVIP